MKKALTYWFALLLILLVASAVLVSCKTKQPLQNTTIESTEKVTDTNTLEKIRVNQAILDALYLKIAKIYSSKPECDSLINFYRNELAKSIAVSKTSGDNGYEIKFNEVKQQLEFLIKVGQTENKEIIKHTHTNNTYFKEIKVEVAVKLPLTWWENLFYRIGQICTVSAGLLIVFFVVKWNFQK